MKLSPLRADPSRPRQINNLFGRPGPAPPTTPLSREERVDRHYARRVLPEVLRPGLLRQRLGRETEERPVPALRARAATPAPLKQEVRARPPARPRDARRVRRRPDTLCAPPEARPPAAGSARREAEGRELEPTTQQLQGLKREPEVVAVGPLDSRAVGGISGPNRDPGRGDWVAGKGPGS